MFSWQLAIAGISFASLYSPMPSISKVWLFNHSDFYDYLSNKLCWMVAVVFSELLSYTCMIQVKALLTFQHDVDCMALLMDGSAALGLDLSFVTHVYLMEPIWDKR